MSGFTVPNAVNYSSPLNAVPLDWTSSPVEGPKGIQCSIAWGTQGGPNNAVYVNCQNNATLNFSKIRALIIDNSRCGSDVEFIFPDTETTVSVPSYTPYAIIPVFTNQTQFYVSCPNAEPEDISNFTILNTSPSPVTVPTTQEQNFYSSAPVNAAVSGSKQLLASNISGTLEALTIVGYITNTADSASIYVSLEDGAGNVFMQSSAACPPASTTSFTLFNLSDLRIRFTNGLTLNWTTTAAGGTTGAFLSPNVYYRTP